MWIDSFKVDNPLGSLVNFTAKNEFGEHFDSGRKAPTQIQIHGCSQYGNNKEIQGVVMANPEKLAELTQDIFDQADKTGRE